MSGPHQYESDDSSRFLLSSASAIGPVLSAVSCPVCQLRVARSAGVRVHVPFLSTERRRARNRRRHACCDSSGAEEALGVGVRRDVSNIMPAPAKLRALAKACRVKKGSKGITRHALGSCFYACRCPETAAHFRATCTSKSAMALSRGVWINRLETRHLDVFAFAQAAKSSVMVFRFNSLRDSWRVSG